MPLRRRASGGLFRASGSFRRVRSGQWVRAYCEVTATCAATSCELFGRDRAGGAGRLVLDALDGHVRERVGRVRRGQRGLPQVQAGEDVMHELRRGRPVRERDDERLDRGRVARASPTCPRRRRSRTGRSRRRAAPRSRRAGGPRAWSPREAAARPRAASDCSSIVTAASAMVSTLPACTTFVTRDVVERVAGVRRLCARSEEVDHRGRAMQTRGRRRRRSARKGRRHCGRARPRR